MRRTAPRAAALAIAITAGWPSAALAGPHDKAIVEIIDAAVADWTILLSCSVLERETHDLLLDIWADEREEVDALLAEAEVAPQLAADINARLAPDRLLEPTQGDAQTLIALCRGTDWRRQAVIFTFVRPAAEIEELL